MAKRRGKNSRVRYHTRYYRIVTVNATIVKKRGRGGVFRGNAVTLDCDEKLIKWQRERKRRYEVRASARAGKNINERM